MKVLLAIDGSPCSQAAVESALSTKYEPHVEIKVASVVDFFEPLPSVEGAKEQEIKEAQNLVSQTVKRLQDYLPDNKISGVVLDGYTKEAIVKAAEEWPADLIIVGSHGRGGVSSFLLGSVSRALLHSAPCAVRIMRINKGGVASSGSERINVLVAMDESEHSQFTFEHVLSSFFPKDVSFKCLTVLPEPKEPALKPASHKANRQMHLEEQRRLAMDWLQKCVARLEQKFGSAKASCAVLEGDPREQIIQAAKEWPADLIILGSHSRPVLDALVLGSTADTVAQHALCSAEIVRSPLAARKKLHVIV